uniref:Integrase catalytic domain-containing protein n=1 Tax=Chenopodium quinoa TaxID=63459 RepID=A0A803N713_CHEQI
MEIALTSKKKIGFVLGTVLRSAYAEDVVKTDQWDTCNSMVISWIHSCLSDTIKKYVLYVNTARETWVQLEKRFSMANGSRKYKLNKDLYSLKQNSNTVNVYYTVMSSLWEELDSMNAMPVVTETTAEMRNLLNAIAKYQEESRLFQFLNGLSDQYSAMRTQLLMMTPLPTVDTACSILQQEESQREVLQLPVSDNDAYAMYIGYPTWHSKYRPGNSVKGQPRNSEQKWSNNRPPPKLAAVAQSGFQGGGNITLTQQQFEQILKLMPSSSAAKGCETDDELDNNFSGMVLSCDSEKLTKGWILDSGATDHMTSDLSSLSNLTAAKNLSRIVLPTGTSSVVSHTGNAELKNSIVLKNVLVVPNFKYNLLSVPKLTKDSQCEVNFYGSHCVIKDTATKKIMGIGKAKNGLYYLINKPLNLDESSQKWDSHTCLDANTEKKIPFAVWHHRLGHASVGKLQHIPCVKKTIHEKTQVCITCPMAKFTKVPYFLSESHAISPFELIHMDISGPYKVCTRRKYRYFLTIVDDCSRNTWVYLLIHKSDALSHFKAFYNYALTHFNSKIKILRSDNALEFDDGPYFLNLEKPLQSPFLDWEDIEPENKPDNTTNNDPPESPQNQPEPTQNNQTDPDSSNQTNTDSIDHTAETENNSRHSTRISKPPNWWKDYVAPKKRSDRKIANFANQSVNQDFHYFMIVLAEHQDPVHFKQAVT